MNIPDTVGYATPLQYAKVIGTLKERVPNIGQAIISTHCHDDLGLAVANSLAGCEAGARQVECTINGIGERAGNAALEEVVMSLKTRFDYYGLTTSIKTERLYPISRMLSTITGLAVQRNKAIVGRNAFAHESGIHQDGMLKERSTYEIMRPEDVGVPRTDLVLGKHSGRHALRERVAEMGYTLADEQLEIVFNDFKTLADKKKEVYDEDLVVLIEKHLEDATPHWQLISLHTTAGMGILPTATIAIRRPDGEIVQDAAIGDGPVDAIFKAVERVTGVHANLHEFVVRSVTQGKDAQGEVTLELEVESDDRSYPRPRRLDRHHRGLGPGVPQRRQRDRHPQGARTRPRGRRPARGGGVSSRWARVSRVNQADPSGNFGSQAGSNDMSREALCRCELARSSKEPSPFDRAIVLGWYDGPSDGLIRCGACKRIFRFELLDSVDEDREIQIYSLAQLPADSMDRLVNALSPFMKPYWPMWAPLWKFPTEDDRIRVDRAVDDLIARACSPEVVVMTSGLLDEILDLKPVSAPLDYRSAERRELPPQDSMS